MSPVVIAYPNRWFFWLGLLVTVVDFASGHGSALAAWAAGITSVALYSWRAGYSPRHSLALRFPRFGVDVREPLHELLGVLLILIFLEHQLLGKQGPGVLDFVAHLAGVCVLGSSVPAERSPDASAPTTSER